MDVYMILENYKLTEKKTKEIVHASASCYGKKQGWDLPLFFLPVKVLSGKPGLLNVGRQVIYQQTVNVYVTHYLVAYLQINKWLFFMWKSRWMCLKYFTLLYTNLRFSLDLTQPCLTTLIQCYTEHGHLEKNGIIYFVKPIPNMWEHGTELIHQEDQ